ncbi:MAG: hypothetical protein LLF28_02720 [Nitrospiraceae bacterium]|nr:hypothetical protein [Nitrospiraceae bacterium]
MKTLKTLIFVFILVLFIAPITHAGDVEDLIGISLNYSKKEVTINVVGSGCTDKGDFLFEMKNDVLTVVRTKIDSCKAMQQEVSLTYSFKEAGISPNKPFKIANRFIANIYIANMRPAKNGK